MFSQTAVFALNGTYHLGELELEVTIPSGYSVITQDTSEYDPIFSALGISGTELIDRFKTNGIYLNAVSNTNSEEIVVTNTKINLSNFSLISDTALTAFASAFINEITNRGMETFKYDIYQHTQKSAFCSPRTVVEAFDDVIRNANFEYIFLSYNNEGLMPFESIREVMQRYGEYEMFSTDYRRFKADTDENRKHKCDKTVEYLHCLIKRWLLVRLLFYVIIIISLCLNVTKFQKRENVYIGEKF